MSGDVPALAGASGTPKMGIDCGVCDDWGTVVITEVGRSAREEPCPAECPAAERARMAADIRQT